MFYLFYRYLFVESQSKEGRKTAQLVIKQLQQMTAYRDFENEIPESDSGTGNDHFLLCR
jgi:hypothetical protein